MNYAQTIDPYKVWNRFPVHNIQPQTQRYNKVRSEVLAIIDSCPGSCSKEIRSKTGRKKRAMFALLQSLRHDGLVQRIGQRYYLT